MSNLNLQKMQPMRAGGMRLNTVKRKTRAPSATKIVEEILNNFKQAPLTSVSGVRFLSKNPQYRFQFNSPNLKMVHKANLILITGLATQREDEDPKELAEYRNPSQSYQPKAKEKALKTKLIQKGNCTKLPQVHIVQIFIKNETYVIENALVFCVEKNKSYMVFGKAVPEKQVVSLNDTESLLEQQGISAFGAEDDETIPDLVSSETPSTEGVSTNDVEIVAQEGKVSKERALELLQEHQGDLVQAILACS